MSLDIACRRLLPSFNTWLRRLAQFQAQASVHDLQACLLRLSSPLTDLAILQFTVSSRSRDDVLIIQVCKPLDVRARTLSRRSGPTVAACGLGRLNSKRHLPFAGQCAWSTVLAQCCTRRGVCMRCQDLCTRLPLSFWGLGSVLTFSCRRTMGSLLRPNSDREREEARC